MYEANESEVLATIRIGGVNHQLSLDEEDVAHLMNKGEYYPISEVPLLKRLPDELPSESIGNIVEIKEPE